jgi:hypothetical protein
MHLEDKVQKEMLKERSHLIFNELEDKLLKPGRK